MGFVMCFFYPHSILPPPPPPPQVPSLNILNPNNLNYEGKLGEVAKRGLVGEPMGFRSRHQVNPHVENEVATPE